MIHYHITTRAVDTEDETIYMEDIESSFLLPKNSIGKGQILLADGSGYPDRRITHITLKR